MNVVTLIPKNAKELSEVNSSTFSLLKSITHTIKLLDTATQIQPPNGADTSDEIEKWIDEAHNCVQSFSSNLMRKIEHFGQQGLDPRLLMINSLVPHVDRSIDSLTGFAEDVHIILRQKTVS